MVIITKGVSDIFIDNILEKLKEYIAPNYKIVLNILSIYIQAEGSNNADELLLLELQKTQEAILRTF